MANPLRGVVATRVGGLDYRLEFTIDVMCALEARLETTATAIVERMGKDDSLGFLRTMLWASLREHHPELDEREAGELLREVGGADLKVKVLAAFVAAWPSREAAADGDVPPRKRPTRRPTAAAAGTGTGS